MLGILVAPGGDAGTGEPYLVAAVDLAPGEPIGSGDLEHQTMQLPAAVAGHTLSDLDGEGTVARVAVPAGSVMLADHVRTLPAGTAQGPTVTITVPEGRALGGKLSVGDLLHVVATYGSGTEGFSEVIAPGVTVIDVVPTADTLGVDPGVTVTLRLGPGGPVLPVVHAAHADAVSLVSGDVADPSVETTFRPNPPELGTFG
jgi:hypothetical protein